jgi:diguanylate cyclase (GGDEF)-like protein/PAS domain S-box-containing protein
MRVKRTKKRSRALRTSLMYVLVASVWMVSAHGLQDVAGSEGFFARLWSIKSAFLFIILTTLLLYYHLHLFEMRQYALARHFGSIGKYANDIILLINEHGRIVEFNDRALSAYGYTYEEMLALHDVDLLAPEGQAEIEEAHADLGKGIVYETRYRRKDGTTFFAEVSIRAIDSQGHRWRQAIIRDISDRKQAEQALRESEENLRNIMESSLVSIYVIQDGVFKYINRTLLEKSGYTAEELLGWRNPLDLIAPEFRKIVAQNLQERLAGIPGHPYEIKVLRKDGSQLDVLAWGAVIQYQGKPANVGTILDISEHKQAENELRKLSHAIEQSASTVVVANRDGVIEYVNPRFTETTGYTREEAIGQNPRLLKSGHTSQEDYQKMWQTITAGQVWRGEFKNKRKDGSFYWEFAIISPVVDDSGKITNFVAIKEDITQQKEAADRLDQLVHYESLTGLFNRETLRERLAFAIDVAQQEQNQIGIVSFDIDRFKDINDSLGPPAGDQILVQLSERLRHSFRSADALARVGGDEFVAVISHAGVEGAGFIGQKLLGLVQEPFEVGGRIMSLTCSVGIAIFPTDGTDVDTLMRNADAAQHQAKAIGGNNCQFFSVSMNTAALNRLTIASELRTALLKEELELYFQPQVRLVDGVIDGAEALVRWRHPEKGMMPPAEFIPIAEESGIIVEIGLWVLNQACLQAKKWQDEGLPALPVAVNLSAVQFSRGDVLGQVAQALAISKLAPCYLELEITESVILQEMEKVQHVLQRLGELGVAVSIDDFGTGYSSFTYLRKLHIDKLKIDQSFVRGVVDNQEDVAIVNATIALAKAFKLNVVAEGVETADQYRFMQEAGCDQVQGYYCSKPLSIEQFKEALVQGCSH